MKGSVRFFMDFLIEHPTGKWLVASPSTSPENPPKGPGYGYFFDEVTGTYHLTTMCHGSTTDNQILTDLFGYYAEASGLLGLDDAFMDSVTEALAMLVPPQIGKDGTLQDGTEDFGQMEDKHRHFSHMYGLHPGNVLSVKKTPQFINARKAVLEQRGPWWYGILQGMENGPLGQVVRRQPGCPDFSGLYWRIYH